MTRDKIQQLAILAGSNSIFMSANTVFMDRFAALVMQEAANTCASVYHQHIGPEFGEVRHGIAACEMAIRAMKPEVK